MYEIDFGVWLDSLDTMFASRYSKLVTDVLRKNGPVSDDDSDRVHVETAKILMDVRDVYGIKVKLDTILTHWCFLILKEVRNGGASVYRLKCSDIEVISDLRVKGRYPKELSVAFVEDVRTCTLALFNAMIKTLPSDMSVAWSLYWSRTEADYAEFCDAWVDVMITAKDGRELALLDNLFEAFKYRFYPTTFGSGDLPNCPTLLECLLSSNPIKWLRYRSKLLKINKPFNPKSLRS